MKRIWTYWLCLLCVGCCLLGEEDEVECLPSGEHSTMWCKSLEVTLYSASASTADVYNGTLIYYTTDGSDPTKSSTRKSVRSEGVAEIAGYPVEQTLKACLGTAVASSSGTTYKYGTVTTVTYTNTYTPEAPSLSPSSTTFYQPLSVALEAVSEDTVATYYTTDGSDPRTSTSRAVWSGNLTISDTTTVKVVNETSLGNGKTKLADAATVFQYDCSLAPATPTITPADGTRVDSLSYGQNTVTVSIVTDYTDARIYYTLDGTAPVVPEGGGEPTAPTKLYAGAFVLSEPGLTTIFAVAYKSKRPVSETAMSRIFLYNRPEPPKMQVNREGEEATSEWRGELRCVQFVSGYELVITAGGDGAKAYYSDSGEVPTDSSKEVGTTIRLAGTSGGCAIAYAVDSDGFESRYTACFVRKRPDELVAQLLASADINKDGRVEVGDYGLLAAAWGSAEGSCDLTGDGTVNQRDVDWMQSLWWGDQASLLEKSTPRQYLVIDLSGGPDADSYPYEFLDSLPGGSANDDRYKGAQLLLTRIPAGTFTMGSPASEVGRQENSDGTSDEDAHQVTLTAPYYMGVFETTQKQWYNVMGTWPSYYNAKAYREHRPVESVSYGDIRGTQDGSRWPDSGKVDVRSFLGKLRAKTGLWQLELPTEAQWERAARACTSTPFYGIGTQLSSAKASYHEDLGIYARYYYNNTNTARNADPLVGGTGLVGSRTPNLFGLYDMEGNVAEWCRDAYSKSYTVQTATDPDGAAASSIRVVRGGTCKSYPAACRSAARGSQSATSSLSSAVGFRLSFWLPY